MTGALITTGIVLTALLFARALYVFVVDPDWLNRMNSRTLRSVSALALAAILFAVVPVWMSRNSENQSAVEADEPSVAIVSACEALWEQFLETNDSEAEFKLWATWQRYCG